MCNLKSNETNLWTTLGVSFWAFWYTYCLLSKTGSDGCRETRGTGTRETTCKPRQDFNISKGQIFLFLWLCMSHIKRKSGPLFAPLKRRHVAQLLKKKKRGSLLNTCHVLSPHSAQKLQKLFSLSFSRCYSFLLPHHWSSIKAPTFAHHFCSKSRKEAIFGVVKRTSTLWDFKFQVWVDFFSHKFSWVLGFGRYDG